MSTLDGAVVLITGAGGGFGQQLCRQLRERGSRLILSDRSRESLAAACDAAGEAAGAGTVLGSLIADLSTAEGCQQLVKQVGDLCSRQSVGVDVVIHNAGVALVGRVDELSRRSWEDLLQINLLAPMRLSALMLPEMIRRRRGHLVFMSSIGGRVPVPGLGVYSASKGGLDSFAESLHHDLRALGLRVSVVHPFFSRTPMLEGARAQATTDQGRLGSLASLATDPARVMARTIRAIECNRLHVYPDPMASCLDHLKRWFPRLSIWAVNRLSP